MNPRRIIGLVEGRSGGERLLTFLGDLRPQLRGLAGPRVYRHGGDGYEKGA